MLLGALRGGCAQGSRSSARLIQLTGRPCYTRARPPSPTSNRWLRGLGRSCWEDPMNMWNMAWANVTADCAVISCRITLVMRAWPAGPHDFKSKYGLVCFDPRCNAGPKPHIATGFSRLRREKPARALHRRARFVRLRQPESEAFGYHITNIFL